MLRSSVTQLFLAVFATFLVVGCGPSEEEVRNELREMGIEYNSEYFRAAAEAGKDSVVKLFLQGGMSPDARGESGMTPLMAAAKGRSDSASAEVVETLLEWDADPGLENESATPLHFAAEGKNTEVVEILIESGVSLNSRDSFGRTALMYAASFEDNYEMVRSLLDAGADPNLSSDDKRTALMNASKTGGPRVVEALVQAGADLNVQTKSGKTALMSAARSYGNAKEKVATLVNAGADLNLQDEDGATALIHAIDMRNNEGAVATLADAGSNLDIRIEEGETALMLAAHQGNKEIVSTLLDAGVDPNVRDNYGNTALMKAADRDGHEEIVTTLLDANADPTIEDNDGETALYKTYNDEIESMLKRVMAGQE